MVLCFYGVCSGMSMGYAFCTLISSYGYYEIDEYDSRLYFFCLRINFRSI